MAWASRYYFDQGTTLFPLFREAPQKVTPHPLKDYHTQIAGCTELAGCAVKDKQVKMTAAQAQYWIDQGVIGDAAGEHPAGAALAKK